MLSISFCVTRRLMTLSSTIKNRLINCGEDCRALRFAPRCSLGVPSAASVELKSLIRSARHRQSTRRLLEEFNDDRRHIGGDALSSHRLPQQLHVTTICVLIAQYNSLGTLRAGPHVDCPKRHSGSSQESRNICRTVRLDLCFIKQDHLSIGGRHYRQSDPRQQRLHRCTKLNMYHIIFFASMSTSSAENGRNTHRHTFASRTCTAALRFKRPAGRGVISLTNVLLVYRRGIVKVNVAPSPGALCTAMLPPIRFTSDLTIARPRPLPPKSCEMDASACTKLSKI